MRFIVNNLKNRYVNKQFYYINKILYIMQYEL